MSGGRDLKASQHYPRLFGAAFAQLYLSEQAGVRTEIQRQKILSYESMNAQSSFRMREQVVIYSGHDFNTQDEAGRSRRTHEALQGLHRAIKQTQ